MSIIIDRYLITCILNLPHLPYHPNSEYNSAMFDKFIKDKNLISILCKELKKINLTKYYVY